MPSLTNTKIVTKTSHGEITINLNLSITIDGNGKISVEAKESTWKPDMVVPEIEIGKTIEFGKNV